MSFAALKAVFPAAPPLLTGHGLCNDTRHWTGVAQLVEHRSPKPRVPGSSPGARASFSF